MFVLFFKGWAIKIFEPFVHFFSVLTPAINGERPSDQDGLLPSAQFSLNSLLSKRHQYLTTRLGPNTFFRQT